MRSQTGRRRGGRTDPLLARRRVVTRQIETPMAPALPDLLTVVVQPPSGTIH